MNGQDNMGTPFDKPKQEKRSPLKDKPLPPPGQSLTGEILTAGMRKILYLTMFNGVAIGLTLGAMLHLAFPTWLTLAVLIVIAIAFSSYVWWKIGYLPREFDSLILGRDGERVVGQFLETQRERGWKVFHDLVGDGFNIDHVVVCPQGIYTIETKTLSKPVKGNPKIELKDGKVLVNGRPMDRDPIAQAKAQAKWLRDILASSTGKTYPVRPVVVFPGWWVERIPNTENRDVWLLEHKALPGFVSREPIKLRSEEVALVVDRLTRHIQAALEKTL